MNPFQNIIKASYHTLGCKLNFTETESICRALEEKGISRAGKDESPDLCVVNTCSVTATADKKAKNLIRSLARRYPEASIIVTGCYAQLKPEEAAGLPGVAMVLGCNEKGRAAELISTFISDRTPFVDVTPTRDIKNFYPTCQRGERTRYFLKVQDGCNYYCTYCTIPYARGASRSGTIAQMEELARQAARDGGKEIVITGVNIGEFGKDHCEDFFSLIKRLDEIEGIERFRISSIEPNLLSEEIIRWIAEESRAFMPHFHIPLQAGSDKVLKLMARRYDTHLFSSRINYIRKYIPDAYIGVDIIAGARGETPEEWEKSLAFAKSLDISKFHIFPYSEREGTTALRIAEKVSQEEKHRRVAVLSEVSEKKTEAFIARNLGMERDVLWETEANGLMTGHTDNYLRVTAPFRPGLINKISKVRLERVAEKDKDLIEATHVDS